MKTSACHAFCWMMLTIVSRVMCQKSKGSIFDSKPIRVQDYGTPPVTSTIPLYDCSSSHRPKSDIPGAYEIYHDKQWYLQSCQEGLTWNQSLCRCEFPNGNRLVVQCRDYRATSQDPTGKYEQMVNGQWIVRDCSLAVAGLVWDQEACQCVWGPDSKEMVTGQGIAPCEIMLNMTFENGVKDEAKNSYVEVGRGKPVPVFAVNKKDSPDGYKAAYFSDTALNIWYFAGNEMGSSLRVEFRFKMTNDPIQRDKYQIFISNGCNISSPGYTTPSLAIGYRAADQSYLLAFETASARKAIVCTRKLADRLDGSAQLGGLLMHDKADMVKALWEHENSLEEQVDYHGLVRLVQRGVTRGSGRYSTLRGKAIWAYNQIAIGTISIGTLRWLLKLGTERVWECPECCDVGSCINQSIMGAYDWHTISLIYEDGTLLFRVDEQPCIISQDFSGSVQKTPCPLTIGADPLERESMYKGYLDNLLIARYCRRFMDTDPNESKDKAKGPMPVETAPTVSEFAFQQVRPKSEKQSAHSVPGRRQRAVTSAKYFSELPRVLKTGVEKVDHRMPTGEFMEKSMGADERTRSFLRFPRSGDESHGSFQGETPRREQGKEFTRQDTADNQDNDYENFEKPDGQSDDYGKTDVNGKQTNHYDIPVKTPEQENTGHIKSKQNADSRSGYSNSAKVKGKSMVKSSESDESPNESDGMRQTGRQINSNKKFRNVEEFNGRLKNSEQTRRKDKAYTSMERDESENNGRRSGRTSNNYDRSTSRTETNEGGKHHVSAQDNENEDYTEHGNSRENGRQRNYEEQRNDGRISFNKRQGSKYESTNTEKRKTILTSRENWKEEDDNNSREYRKPRGKAQSLERFTKTVESESNGRKSGRKSSNYDDNNSQRDAQKSNGHNSRNGKAVNVDDDELYDGNGKGKNNKPRNNGGFRQKDESENPDGFEIYNNEGELNNGKNIGFQSHSDKLGKDYENVENYSKEKSKEEDEATESNEDYDYAQQTRDKDHEGEKRRPDRTNRDRTRNNRKDKITGGRGHTRENPEQWQVYRDKVRDTVASNFDTQEKQTSESDAYSDKFEGNQKEESDSKSRSNTEPKVIKIIATSNKDGHITLDVSKHQAATEDGVWADDKQFEDLEGNDKNWGPNIAKSRPVRHSSGDISKPGNQQNMAENGLMKEKTVDASSGESFSNLVRGRRKSGSKKTNWYDKVDAVKSKQESSSDDEQNTQLGQNKISLSASVAADKENKRSGKVDIIFSDTHTLEYDRPSTSDKSYGRSKYKDDKADHKNTQSVDTAGKIIFRKELRKPPGHGFIVKDYNEKYEEDYESDQSTRADHNAHVSLDSTDKTSLNAKDVAIADSSNGHTLPMAKNTQPRQIVNTNEQNLKNLDSSDKIKDNGGSQGQEKTTSSLPQKETHDRDESHFNMPVDITKITSSRPADPPSNSPQDKTPDLSDAVKQSPALSEKSKTLRH